MGGVLVALGIMLTAAAVGLTCYNFWDDQRAESAAKSVLEQIEQSVDAIQGSIDGQTNDMLTPGGNEPDTDSEMPTLEIDGYRYIGVIRIPALELELPVMEEWDYTRMKTAPCRYLGSFYSSDLIIAGHNYSSHFGTLRDLEADDEVIFTDVNGNSISYTVYLIEILDGMAVEEMQSGGWDLTLFTCTTGGEARVTVRCMVRDGQS